MTAYPYKTVKAGKYTKYIFYVIDDGSVLIEHKKSGTHKGTPLKTFLVGRYHFKNEKELMDSKMPKHVKETGRWAFYEASGLIN